MDVGLGKAEYFIRFSIPKVVDSAPKVRWKLTGSRYLARTVRRRPANFILSRIPEHGLSMDPIQARDELHFNIAIPSAAAQLQSDGASGDGAK